MLFDDLQEQLKNLSPDISLINSFWQKSPLEAKYHQLEQQTQQEDFWQNPKQAEILKELQRIRHLREQYLAITNSNKDLQDLITMFKDDDSELKRLSGEIRTLQKTIAHFKVNILLNKPEDNSNCFLNINAGAGGTESQDWAEILLRMYVRFCERENLNVSILDQQIGEGAGIKSATLFIRGKNSCGLLKSEAGIHRLVRISPFDANKRRHTSFCAVTITPEVPEQEITIDPSELRIDTYRSGGAGGQHVNKTESAIRITHIPTNTVVQCQIERSQAQNKETAMKMLKAKLAQKQKEEQEAKAASVEKKKIEWGSQIRSYVLHPYKMIKDHRTDFESMQPDLVLDGDLMGFIESYLVWHAQEHQ
jgi:peptide chain release factor 2